MVQHAGAGGPCACTMILHPGTASQCQGRARKRSRRRHGPTRRKAASRMTGRAHRMHGVRRRQVVLGEGDGAIGREPGVRQQPVNCSRVKKPLPLARKLRVNERLSGTEGASGGSVLRENVNTNSAAPGAATWRASSTARRSSAIDRDRFQMPWATTRSQAPARTGSASIGASASGSRTRRRARSRAADSIGHEIGQHAPAPGARAARRCDRRRSRCRARGPRARDPARPRQSAAGSHWPDLTNPATVDGVLHDEPASGSCIRHRDRGGRRTLRQRNLPHEIARCYLLRLMRPRLGHALVVTIASAALTGVVAGLARLGLSVDWAASRAGDHGPLLVLGVFAVVVAQERAAVLGSRWALAAPAGSACAAIAILAGGLPGPGSPWRRTPRWSRRTWRSPGGGRRGSPGCCWRGPACCWPARRGGRRAFPCPRSYRPGRASSS